MKKMLFILASTLVLQLFPNGISTAAAGSPRLTIISPSDSGSFYWNTAFKLEFKLEGGWASSLNDCRELSAKNFNFWVGMNYSPTESLLLRSRGASYSYYMWDTKLIPDGIQCSINVNQPTYDTDSLYWSTLFLENTYASNVMDLNIHSGELSRVQGPQKILFAWVIDDQVFKSSRNANEAVVKLEFVGLNRGDDISYSKSYQVRMERPIDAPPIGINGVSNCIRQSVESFTATLVALFNCNTSTTGEPGTRSFTVSTNGYANEYAKSVTVNFIKTGYPVLEAKPTLDLTSNSAYQKEFVEFKVFGSLILKGSNLNTTPQVIRICIDQLMCDQVNSSADGKFNFSRIVEHKPGALVKWSIESNYDGVALRTSGEQAFTAIPKPIPVKPNPITRMQYFLPKTVKWGNAFTVSITPSGKGSAQCAIWFQATSPYNGRYDFRITAGKTSRVSIRPTYYQIAAWPVSLRCWPDNWERNILICLLEEFN